MKLAALTITVLLAASPLVVSAATIEGDSLTVGTRPYSACPVNAHVGRFSREVNLRPGIIVTTGANDGALNRTLIRRAVARKAQWATIWLPGRPSQSNRFNAALLAAGLGAPDWASHARTLPANVWAADGVHMTPSGYKTRAAFFNMYC